jgi:hypothetical protein
MTILQALMAGVAPSSIVGVPPRKKGLDDRARFWEGCDRAAREMTAWPEWKKVR